MLTGPYFGKRPDATHASPSPPPPNTLHTPSIHQTVALQKVLAKFGVMEL